MTDPIRLLLVDDQPVLVESLTRRFVDEEDLSVVATANDEVEARNVLERKTGQIDVALLDVRMSQHDAEGLELAEYMHMHYPEVRVIMLSMFDKKDYVGRMFESGIAGYVLKTSHTRELIEAIRFVHQNPGKRHYRGEIRDLVDEYFDGEYNKKGQTYLTPTEKYILQLIWEGLLSKEIAGKMGTKECTVETHRRNMSDKLGVKGGVLLVKEGLRLGYLDIE